MKTAKYIPVVVLAALAFTSCEKDLDLQPEGGSLLAAQVQETNVLIPERGAASFNGLFSAIGQPNSTFNRTSPRADDFAFIAMCLSNDYEGSDAILPDSGYNWFSVCGEYTSRTPSYANPYIRYATPYREIAAVNDFLAGYPENVEDPLIINMIAQARAIRAWSYMFLAPAFQFGYAAGAADKPCVPIVTENTEDFTNNPRATVEEVYKLIMEDLDYAVEHLEGASRTSKMYIDQQVAYGLRARANLYMNKWAEAAADAEKAAAGYEPASIAEVSKPAFMDINEHNWMWGYDMTADMAMVFRYATCSSWLSSFSAWGYTAGAACYVQMNNLLYDKIPATDVRKGWWLDENLYSPLLEGLTWDSLKGQQIATETIPDVKEPMPPYTNVKFGCNPIGTTANEEDYPLMRVEEMILIQAEGYAKSGQEAKAREILESFVQTYRDPSYSAVASGRSLSDEIWFQRRVELWGEGFGVLDTKRLNKPLVRFQNGKASNWPGNFRFNIAANDGWMLMRFPQDEMNTNYGIVDNTDGKIPVIEQNGELRDGVTD